VQARLQSVQAMVDEAVKAGFYASYESMRLSGAEDLVKSADSAITEGDPDYVYANLHEALIIIEDVEKGLPSIYVNVSRSVLFITPFLGFTAVAVASVLFDGMHRRLIMSLALYGILLSILYFLYPGYIILQKTDYNPWAATVFEGVLVPLLIGASFLAAFFVIQVLPRAFREKTSMEGLKFMSALAAAFSVAARNLRRRRLRAFLTSAFMLTSVFAFVVLTSISFEQGFFIQSHPGQAPAEGFLMRKRPLGEITPFMPIEPNVLQWLENRNESALVVPKIENTPQVGTNAPPPPLAALHAPNSSSSFPISGALGVYPSREVKVTKMDDIVARGKFLDDGDLNGILISEEAEETLQVEVNTTLKFYDRSFIVTGIFNSKKLGELKDLDGAPLVPQQIIITITQVGSISKVEYVPYERVAIVHVETAKNLGLVISRIDVQTQSPEDTVDLARLAVLVWPDVQAFASLAGGIQHLFIGSAYVVKGFAEGMVPLVLVVLNVGVMMLSAVYERKREATIMSTVGLNPFHISAVFVAEALTLSVVAGSLGYLLGLISYRFFAVFAVFFEVKQKVEAFWGVLALSFSIVAAVLGAALPATKASIIATPSLLRKWKIRIEERPRNAKEPWVLKIPLRIRGEDLGKFFSFMEKRLEGYTSNLVERIENLKVSREGEAEPRLSFAYIFTEMGVVTDNELIPVKSDTPNLYTFKLTMQSRMYRMGFYSGKARDEAHIRRTAAFVRRLILQYSHRA
ncbi:MAG: FtsX-like permease family protein, partial [Candidatus Bathyarchaeia archaeon]